MYRSLKKSCFHWLFIVKNIKIINIYITVTWSEVPDHNKAKCRVWSDGNSRQSTRRDRYFGLGYYNIDKFSIYMNPSNVWKNFEMYILDQLFNI